MKHTKRRKVIGVIAAILVVILGVQIWFRIPFSPLKNDFEKDVERLAGQSSKAEGVFTEEDFAGMPVALQKYVESCGYIGKPKMNYMLSSTGNSVTQFFALMSAFTATYKEGKLNVAFNNITNGVEVRCVRNAE